MKTKIAPFFLALLLTGCATTIYQGKVYQDGSSNVMIAETAHDWSGTGQTRFTHFDGEKFTGEYSTVQEVIYGASLTALFGASGRARVASLAPSFGVSSSNIFYGVSSLIGNQGSSARCVYVGALKGLTSFNIIGVCKDSKERTYTTHFSSDGGARFPDDETKVSAETETRTVRTGKGPCVKARATDPPC